MSATLTGIKIGVPTGVALFATATTNLDDAKISLVVAVPCTVFICGIVWFLARRLQKIDDKLQHLHDRMDNLPCDDCVPWQMGRNHKMKGDE